MAPEASGQSQTLRPNETVSKVRQGGGRAASFAGWVGSDAPAGRTRLHLDLNQLSYYLEFDNNDVLGSADLAENVMPFGAKTVWLKGDARVRLWRSVGTSATKMMRFLSASAMNASPSMVRASMSGAPFSSQAGTSSGGNAPGANPR